ncbi:MAG: FMN-binding protein [Ruminococcus sp.]|nr:FMN-binding protein [Ruminococcus sp.]
MKDKVKPTLVLTVICVIAALLLVLAYEATADSISAQREEKFSESIEALFGDCGYTLLDDNFGSDEIESIAVTDDNKTAFQLCVDGYSKDGIEVLIGIDESGEICGIEFVSLGETPGLGTKVRDEESFCQQFIGASEAGGESDTVTGATYSSKGMIHAIDTALAVYNENKEAILNG